MPQMLTLSEELDAIDTHKDHMWTATFHGTPRIPHEEHLTVAGVDMGYVKASSAVREPPSSGYEGSRFLRLCRANKHRNDAADANQSLRRRLANVNNYFALKADEVLIDEPSLGLLAKLHEAVVVEISEFDACENGIALARLTAANFCEVGANVIYITEAGQRFVDSIMDS